MDALSQLKTEVTRLAHPVEKTSSDEYAVVLETATGDRYGFFKIGSQADLLKSVSDLVKHQPVMPREMITKAAGVINTIHQARDGASLPVFTDVEPARSNTMKTADVNWSAYQEKLNPEREGFEFRGQFLPLDTAANVKAAAELLETYEDEFSGPERLAFAHQIKTAAAEHEVSLNGSVEKYASAELNPAFDELVDERIKIAADYPPTVEVLKMVKTYAAKVEPAKVAEALAVTDRMLPFGYKFANHHALGSARPIFSSALQIPDAYTTVFGSPPAEPQTFAEKAAELTDEELGRYFTSVFINQLRETPNETVKNAAPQVVGHLRELVEKAG